MTSLLCRPSRVFVSNGEVFFADSGNHRVRKVLRNGQIVTIAGTGIAGYNGDDQPATNAQLNYPHGVFVSSRNEVYISETEGRRIRKILQNGNIVTVAGTGVYGYIGDNIPATSAKLSSSSGIYVNDEGDELYIADTNNHCIRKVLKNGNITTISKQSISTPIDVSVVRNEIYVCYQGGHCIKKIDSNGVITTIAGTGIPGRNESELATQCQLNYPSGMFVTEQQEVYIADYYNHCVRKVLTNGKIITIAITGEDTIGGDVIDHKPATKTNGPYSVFVDREEIYIAEFLGNRIRKIDRNGIIKTIAGDVQGDKGYSGDVPFDFQKYPHIGPKKKQLIKPFPHAYHDLIVLCEEQGEYEPLTKKIKYP